MEIIELRYKILDYFHFYDLLQLDYFHPSFKKRQNDSSLELYLTYSDLIHWILTCRMDILYKIYVYYRNKEEKIEYIKYENEILILLLLYGTNEMIEYYFRYFTPCFYVEEYGIYYKIGLEMMVYEMRNDSDIDRNRMRYMKICQEYKNIDKSIFSLFMDRLLRRRNYIDYRNKIKIEIGIQNKIKQMRRENKKIYRIHFVE